MEADKQKAITKETSTTEKKEEIPHNPSGLSLEERFNLIMSVGEECIEPAELKLLLEKKPVPVAYDGFEPSGRMHLAQGIVKAHNVNKLTKAGCKFIFWVADWFALMNNKMGGDIKKIQAVGRYMIEVWKACGMDMTNVVFMWSSEEISKNANDYWMRVIDIASKNSVTRVTRCSQIMGRKETDNLMASQIMYPCMQCADIFHLKADICQLGMDQRKVNVLAREYCDQIKRKFKPIILSHHMLPGLLKGQEKASKSDPSSAIFMEDTEAEVNVKIKKCYCPPKEIAGNPVIDYIQHVIFLAAKEFVVKRTAENGGDKVYTKIEDVKADFESGALHPDDAKTALAAGINKLLQPVRDHLSKDPEAAKLCKLVREYSKKAAEDKEKEKAAAEKDKPADKPADAPAAH